MSENWLDVRISVKVDVEDGRPSVEVVCSGPPSVTNLCRALKNPLAEVINVLYSDAEEDLFIKAMDIVLEMLRALSRTR
jgi:hypothetical protein